MKYIRTKDGRIEMVDEQDHGRYASLYPYFEREADTIEELCDEFVGIYKGRHIKSLSKDLWILKDCEVIYGAIWTDKGLIYVAKMNSEGVLELL